MCVIVDNFNVEELVEYCGWLMVIEVQVVGFDLSFVLVLDFDYQCSVVVGSCVFEGDLECVVLFVGVFICGMYVVGMVVIGKYFFGYGWVEVDFYVVIFEDVCSFEEIWCSDLVLFVCLVGQFDVLMLVYVIYLQVDLQFVGFFWCWLQEILCGELKFDGVIFSDDLLMVGVYVVGDVVSCIEVVLVVGCDMGLVCNDWVFVELVLVVL